VTDAEFDRLWASGMEREDIGKLAGITGSAVSKRAKKRGLKRRPWGDVKRIRNKARERFLPSVCTPKPLKPIKYRRCPKCFAVYEGQECNAEFHDSAHPLFSIYLTPEAA
jgi:hypothetical protein